MATPTKKPTAKPARKPAKPAAKTVAKKTPAAKKSAPAKPVAAYAMVADKAGGPEVFTRREMDLPKPGKGEVLVAQKAIGLNFIDVYQRTGLYAAPGGYPAVLGSEGAGVVEAIGTGVKGLKKGDRVAYVVPGGAYASHRIVAAEKLVKVPNGVSDVQAAAAMLKGLTAQYLIHDCYKVKKGDTVLVHAAAGGVGSIVGQWLKAKGAIAIGTAGGAAKIPAGEKGRLQARHRLPRAGFRGGSRQAHQGQGRGGGL